MSPPVGLRFVRAIPELNRLARAYYGEARRAEVDWDEVLGCWVLSPKPPTSEGPGSGARYP